MKIEPEKVYYEGTKGTLITASRLVIGNSVFYLKDVSSVRMTLAKYHNTSGAFLMLIIGLLLLPLRLTDWFFLIGFGFIFLFIIGMLKAKPGYTLRVRIGSKEINARVSNDEKYIQTLIEAVNQAIQDRQVP